MTVPCDAGWSCPSSTPSANAYRVHGANTTGCQEGDRPGKNNGILELEVHNLATIDVAPRAEQLPGAATVAIRNRPFGPPPSTNLHRTLSGPAQKLLLRLRQRKQRPLSDIRSDDSL